MINNNMDKKIKIIVIMIVTFVLIIISLISIIILNKDNNKKNENNNNNNNNVNLIEDTTNTYINEEGLEITDDKSAYENMQFDYEINNKVQYVNNRSDYFTVTSIVNKYIEIIGNQEKTKLNAILSPNYISKYNITNDNIFQKLTIPALDNNMQYYQFRVNNMLTSQIDDTTYVYIVNGSCRIVGKNTIFNIKVMIELDSISKLYNIYPYQYIQDNGIDKIKVGEELTNYNKEEITDRSTNKFTYITVTDKELANKYFDDFKELIFYYNDELYNKLNSEYSKKRFGSKSEFKTYITDNSKVLYSMQINKYKVINTNDYTDFICTDQYDNYYIFRQQGGIMRYTVFLDNYTIMSDEDKEYYNKLDKFDKAKYNLNKFITMVNTKDYSAIYNALDPTFRTNNFKNVENLKQNIKDNLYDVNSIGLEDYDDQTYEYYIFNCKIINMKNTNESKNMTIIMNQTEGTDFTMSFSFE